MGKIGERRLGERYRVVLGIQFWVLEGRTRSKRRKGRTYDISTSGVSFLAGQSLPIDTHLEMIIDWPSRQDDVYPICLQAAGDVVRIAGKRKIAVRMTSCRMIVEKAGPPPEADAFEAHA